MVEAPFTPSSGTDAVKTIGGALSAAGAALAGAVVGPLLQPIRITASVRGKRIPQNRFMVSST
jgi:hypothetical protein